jgi:hypothetical protein
LKLLSQRKKKESEKLRNPMEFFWGTIKPTNIYIMGISKGEERMAACLKKL